MRKAIVVVGLQFGDEGKGQTTDYLCRRLKPDWVIRYCGGSQCAHTVVLPDGRRHTFAQWGAGTFSGVPTYLGPEVIIDPPAMVKEADHLREVGVSDPFALLNIHPDCLVTTFWHQVLNQIKELERRQSDTGSAATCGHGIGETREYWLKHGTDAIRYADLGDERLLRRKVELLRQRALQQVGPLDRRLQSRDRHMCSLLDVTTRAEVDRLQVVPRSCGAPDAPRFQTAVFEGAQGVLLDEWHGFHPYTTWSTVTPHHALEMTGDAEVYTLGVARAFTCRHGLGPHPTVFVDHSLVDENNPYNEWQGRFRWGHLDLPLLRYAAEVVRQFGKLDGIALNHLDVILDAPDSMTKVATSYGPRHEDLLRATMTPDLDAQREVGERLGYVQPTYETMTQSQVVAAVSGIAPVVIQGRGTTHNHRGSFHDGP